MPSPPAPGTVRRPRVWVVINGLRIPALEASWIRSSRRSADGFQATLSLTRCARAGMPVAEWADFQPTDASIVVSTSRGGGDAVVVSSGKVDTPQINFPAWTVSISGRDHSSSLTEKRRSQKFQNKRSSEIVGEIAKDHGLQSSAVETGDDAGLVYTQDTAHLILGQTDFEVLSDLAAREGYRWYVEDKTLYFEPKEQDDDVLDIYWYPPGVRARSAVSNVLDLRALRNMTAARPHEVEVKSWHAHDKKLYIHKEKVGGVGDTIRFTHHANGRKQGQTELLARSRIRDATRHDVALTFLLPGVMDLNPRMKCRLTGTGTIYDQSYDIDAIRGSVSFGGGFTMNVDCKAPKAGRDGKGGSSSSAAPASASPAQTQAPSSVPLPPPRPPDLPGSTGTISV